MPRLPGFRSIRRSIRPALVGTLSHSSRISGRVETAETSALHLDLLRDLKQVNSHLVAAAAYPVLERHSGLLPHRLRNEE